MKALVSILIALTAATVQASTPVDDWVAYILQELPAPQRPCDAASADESGRRQICATYSGGFSAFKSDWDDLMRHVELPMRVTSEEGWVVRGGGYERTLEYSAGRSIDVRLDRSSGALRFAYLLSDEESFGDELDAATNHGEAFVAGFGGVSIPELIADSFEPPTFPIKALEEGILSGVVTAELLVTADGKVQSVKIQNEEPAGYGFGDAAERSWKANRYLPAQLDGRAVAALMQVTLLVQSNPPKGGKKKKRKRAE